MATFSVQEWRTRAERKFNRHKDRSEFQRELRFIRDIEVVIAWCDARGVLVEFKRKPSMYYPDGSNIVVAAGLPTESRLHVLLHECGHHLIGSKDEHERFGRGYSDERTRSAHHKLDVLEEEFEAWHRGFKLAARLGVKVDKDSFDRTRITHLKTYVRWAARTFAPRKKKKRELPTLVAGRSPTSPFGGVDRIQDSTGHDQIPEVSGTAIPAC